MADLTFLYEKSQPAKVQMTPAQRDAYIRRPNADSPLWLYKCLVESARQTGQPIPSPADEYELIWLARNYPLAAERFIPNAEWIDIAGLSRSDFPKWSPKPWSQERKEEFIVTLRDDAEFREAVAIVMGGGQ